VTDCTWSCPIWPVAPPARACRFLAVRESKAYQRLHCLPQSIRDTPVCQIDTPEEVAASDSRFPEHATVGLLRSKWNDVKGFLDPRRQGETGDVHLNGA
jgi:hypothetical protein